MKKVITDKMSIGKDEAWCEWFRCPNCTKTMIYSHAKFCPECGVKLIWKVKNFE